MNNEGKDSGDSPVFFAVLQRSVCVGPVRTHIRVSSGHGTGRDVILGINVDTFNLLLCRSAVLR